jgi:hypothetical protein
MITVKVWYVWEWFFTSHLLKPHIGTDTSKKQLSIWTAMLIENVHVFCECVILGKLVLPVRCNYMSPIAQMYLKSVGTIMHIIPRKYTVAGNQFMNPTFNIAAHIQGIFCKTTGYRF